MSEPKLGAWAAVPAFVVLIVGMLVIGAVSQSRDVLSGLWITEAIAIALPAVFVLCAAQVKIAPYLGFGRLSGKQALVVVVAAAANQPVVSFLTWVEHEGLPVLDPSWFRFWTWWQQHVGHVGSWLPHLPRNLVLDFDAQQRMLGSLFGGSDKYLIMMTVVVAAALGEEIFFRGFYLPALRKSFGLLAAVLISGACFSLVHFEWVGFFGLMEIGILLAALRIWSGSLWAAILGHAVNNAIAGTAFLLGYEDPDSPTPLWTVVLGAALFVAGIVALRRVLQKDLAVEEKPAPPRKLAWSSLAIIWTFFLFSSFYSYTKMRQPPVDREETESPR
ncbi:MAG TPA: CPBP family intramembrane glutamic endopeptidase [Myxococcales bacterium]|jgi:membrane protease YdiL (CAAX protease family)|nr:CPBP family intramembrane glutamic endopeptidase [Myxococcales bacterium]